MPDMLVNLLKLPEYGEDAAALLNKGITVRRVQTFEASRLRRFITQHFSEGWADEVMPGLSRRPVSCFIAIHEKKIIGFAAYECTRRDFFGPTGVAKEYRGNGIGKVLLLACMHGLRDMGYAYAIIGGAGPVDFYSKALGATVIPDSSPGIYADPIAENG